MRLAALLAQLVLASLAALSDHRTRRVPNWLTLGGLLAAFAIRGAQGPSGLAWAFLGALASGAGVFLLYRKGRAGGGDVKLAAAVGAMTTLGPVAVLAGFVLLRFHHPRIVAPFGPPVLAGVLAAVLVETAYACL